MLADVQSEVDVLKDELGDESRIRSEVEKLIEAELQRLAEEQDLSLQLWTIYSRALLLSRLWLFIPVC